MPNDLTNTFVPDDLKYRRTDLPDIIFFDPQQIFDALPEPTRSRIDLEDFKEICIVSLAFTTTYWHEQLARHLKAHVKSINDVIREDKET